MSQADTSLLGRLSWALKSLRAALYLPRLRRHKRELDSITETDALIEQLCSRQRRKGRVRANQNVFEISSLFEIVQAQRPAVVLEIGTSKGGTLYLWSRAAAPGATIISVDLPGGCGTVTPLHQQVYQSFGVDRDIDTHTLAVDSHSEQAHAGVASILAGRTVDFLFIDGDHSYEGVKADLLAYSQFMSPNGIVAMHDVAIPDSHPTITVGKFWRELVAQGCDSEEIIDPDGSSPGIGVVALETSPAIEPARRAA